MLIGPRLNTVFASRWKALFWAISVLISAYFMIPAPDDPEPSAAQTATAPSPWSK
jgi:hypothetical protein